MLVCALGIVGMTQQPPDPLIPLGVVVLGFILNGVYVALLSAGWFKPAAAITASVSDVVLMVVFMAVLSTWIPWFLPLTIFPVLMISVRWNYESALGAAVPILLVYAYPLIPLLSRDPERFMLIEAVTQIAVDALVLVAVALLPGLFARQRLDLLTQQRDQELEELRTDTEHGRIIAEMAYILSHTVDYRKVLKAVLDLTFPLLAPNGAEDNNTVGLVALFEGHGTDLTIIVGRNMSRNDQGRDLDSQAGLVGRTIHAAETLTSHSIQEDKALRRIASAARARSAICAPLRSGFDTYGVVLFATRKTKFYKKTHKELLTTVCNQAIIPMQNAQLFDDLRREQQRILEQEAESRKKWARDLHDGPTQSVAAIAMRLNFIKELLKRHEIEKSYSEIVDVEKIAQRATQEIRTVLFAMRPLVLETKGLIAALEQYAERMNGNESFEVKVINKGYERQLDTDGESVVFAIVEEAVGNAKKHAEASEIRITLLAKESKLWVEIRDNGKGFDVKATMSNYSDRASLGMVNMDERAKLVGGYCTIDSAKGKGTAVRIEIPFEESELEAV